MSIFAGPVDQEMTVKLLEQMLNLARENMLWIKGWQFTVEWDYTVGINIDAVTTFDHMEDLRRAEENFRRGPPRETRLKSPGQKAITHEGGAK